MMRWSMWWIMESNFEQKKNFTKFVVLGSVFVFMLCLIYFLCDYTININNFMLKCELNSLTVSGNETNLQTFIKVSFYLNFSLIFFEIRHFIFPFFLTITQPKDGFDEFNLWFIMNTECWNWNSVAFWMMI